MEPPVDSKIQDEILFGLIALKEGILTQEQLDQAIAIQERSSSRGSSLGTILVELGILKPEAVATILAIQKTNLAKEDPGTGKQRADSLFGRLAVRIGYVTEPQVHECVRIQAAQERDGSPVRLGRILVDKGYLDEAQVRHILKLQDTELVGCKACGKWYNIKRKKAESLPACKHCGLPLAFLSEILPTDAGDLLAGAAETMPDPDRPGRKSGKR